MKELAQFTNLYPKSKTLRFELIPVGETLEHIQEKGIIAEDIARAESYKKMKESIDKFHKDFIEKALCHAKLEGLEEFFMWRNFFSAVRRIAPTAFLTAPTPDGRENL